MHSKVITHKVLYNYNKPRYIHVLHKLKVRQCIFKVPPHSPIGIKECDESHGAATRGAG